MAGVDNTVLTSPLLDEDGQAIGATMYRHLVRAGPGFASVACELNSTIRPRRPPWFAQAWIAADP